MRLSEVMLACRVRQLRRLEYWLTFPYYPKRTSDSNQKSRERWSFLLTLPPHALHPTPTDKQNPNPRWHKIHYTGWPMKHRRQQPTYRWIYSMQVNSRSKPSRNWEPIYNRNFKEDMLAYMRPPWQETGQLYNATGRERPDMSNL